MANCATVRTLDEYSREGPAAGATAVEDPQRNVPVRQKLIDEAFEEWKHVQKFNAKLARIPFWNLKRRETVEGKGGWHHARLMKAFGSMTPAEQAAYHALTGTRPITPIGSEPADK